MQRRPCQIFSSVSDPVGLPFLTNESVDLITIATGLHWLNKDHVFAGIKCVLRPRGFFGSYVYGSVRVDCELADHHLQDVSWKIPPSPYHMSHCLPWNSKSLLKLSNSCRNFCTLGFPFCLLVAPPEEITSSSKLMSETGPWFHIKMPSYQYKKSHCGDKTAVLSPQWDSLYW